MVTENRQLCLTLLMEHIVANEKMLKRLFDHDMQNTREIFHVIERMKVLDIIGKNMEQEANELCKVFIRRYHQVIELKQGRFSGKDIQDTIGTIIKDVLFYKEELLQKIKKPHEFPVKPLHDNAEEVKTLLLKFATNSTNHEVSLKADQSPSVKDISMTRLYEWVLKLNRRITTGGMILVKHKKKVVKIIDLLNNQFDLAFNEYRVSKRRELVYRLSMLEEEVTIKSSETMDILMKCELSILGFLRSFGIIIMETLPGDRFDVQKHTIFKEVKAEGHSNTILNIHTSGFLKDGDLFYPALVTVRV